MYRWPNKYHHDIFAFPIEFDRGSKNVGRHKTHTHRVKWFTKFRIKLVQASVNFFFWFDDILHISVRKTLVHLGIIQPERKKKEVITKKYFSAIASCLLILILFAKLMEVLRFFFFSVRSFVVIQLQMLNYKIWQ